MFLNIASNRTFYFLVGIVLIIFFVLPLGDAHATDAVTARKDLKAMGLEYTDQQFAKSAGEGDMTAVKLFLDAGQNVNAGDGAAIGLAAGRGKTEMVKFLLSKGAKPTSNALQFAQTRGYPEIVKMLTDAGAKE